MGVRALICLVALASLARGSSCSRGQAWCAELGKLRRWLEVTCQALAPRSQNTLIGVLYLGIKGLALICPLTPAVSPQSCPPGVFLPSANLPSQVQIWRGSTCQALSPKVPKDSHRCLLLCAQGACSYMPSNSCCLHSKMGVPLGGKARKLATLPQVPLSALRGL